MVIEDKSIGSRIIDTINYLLLAVLGLSCLLPFIHIIAISFSSSAATTANLVAFWPKGFNTESYRMVFMSGAFMRAFWVSVLRVIAGTALNIIIITLTAYPLSREASDLKGRNIIIWFFIFPMMFGGGLIPFFLVVQQMGLVDKFWVMVIPGAVPIFSVIMMMNFFRGLNKSLYEAAIIDGAGHMVILSQIYIPLSLPSIATLTLFAMVGHWNDWFTGLIFLNDMNKWPLQTYLRQQLITVDTRNLRAEDIERLMRLSNRSLKAAQLFIATVPILCVYPFLQKYFVSGITLGSIKE